MKRIWYWFVRLLNDGVPGRKEVWESVNLRKNGAKITQVMGWYATGMEIHEIAEMNECTRERIRQMLIKGCRK
jgi:hypothetical protein